MASSNTGGWVRRVGSAGGGKTYRRSRPVNFYGILVVICILGLLSIALARYQYQNPAGASQTAPTTSDTWYAALGIDICGDQHPALPANGTTSSTGFVALPDGVIQVHPANATQTGTNATLQLFVASYDGLAVEPRALVLPAEKKGGKQTSYVSGSKCPKGTPDAGQQGHVLIRYWPVLDSPKAYKTNVPGLVLFRPDMLITIGFTPANVPLPKPPSSAIKAMTEGAAAAAATTTTSSTTTTTSKKG